MTRIVFSCAFAFALIAAVTSQAQETESKTKQVTAKNIELKVPVEWKEAEPSSSMRAAQFEIPHEGSGENSDLVVYYFGGQATGGVKANLQRWVGQFSEGDRNVELKKGESQQGKYYWAEIHGTWNKPVGPPRLRRTTEQEDSRVIGVILIAQVDGEDDYYFLKMSGRNEHVKSQAGALRQAIGAEEEAEEKISIDDIDS